jgi:hypothetical protein
MLFGGIIIEKEGNLSIDLKPNVLYLVWKKHV